jgi:hypothetical protein
MYKKWHDFERSAVPGLVYIFTKDCGISLTFTSLRSRCLRLTTYTASTQRSETIHVAATPAVEGGIVRILLLCPRGSYRLLCHLLLLCFLTITLLFLHPFLPARCSWTSATPLHSPWRIRCKRLFHVTPLIPSLSYPAWTACAYSNPVSFTKSFICRWETAVLYP